MSIRIQSIRIQPRQASTFDVERSHPRPPGPNRIQDRPPVKITPFMMLGAIAILTGCHRSTTSTLTNETSNTSVMADASGRSTLPSMTTYTLEQTKGKRAGSISALGATPNLSPGQHCFHKESDENWLSIRLELSNHQQIKGESAGTITHPEQGKTHYNQSFIGTLTQNQARVNVTTSIDGITHSRQEAWTINAATLDIGQVSIAEIPCLEIASSFQP